MAEQNQWNNLIEDWQACEVTKVTETPSALDIKTLQDKTRSRARKMMYFMWADILATIITIVVFGYLMTTDINIHQTIIFAGVLVIIVPVGFYSWWVRRGLWEANGNDTKAYLELAKGRALAGVKLAQANIIAAAIAFPFIIVVIGWRGYLRFDEVDWPFNVYVFGTLFELALMAGMIWGARYYQRKKQAECQRLDKMLSDWSTDEPDSTAS